MAHYTGAALMNGDYDSESKEKKRCCDNYCCNLARKNRCCQCCICLASLGLIFFLGLFIFWAVMTDFGSDTPDFAVYGVWCGPGGLKATFNGTIKNLTDETTPMDRLDELCYIHDVCYELTDVYEKNDGRNDCIGNCDKDLVKSIEDEREDGSLCNGFECEFFSYLISLSFRMMLSFCF